MENTVGEKEQRGERITSGKRGVSEGGRGEKVRQQERRTKAKRPNDGPRRSGQ